MTELFVALLFGHLAGDYLLQSKRMALKKAEPGLAGLGWCICHCVIYSATVTCFLAAADLRVFVLVFFAHFLPDRWTLASKWLKLIGGRDILQAAESTGKYREVDIAFSCFVYAAADNAIHLILMYYLLRLLL